MFNARGLANRQRQHDADTLEPSPGAPSRPWTKSSRHSSGDASGLDRFAHAITTSRQHYIPSWPVTFFHSGAALCVAPRANSWAIRLSSRLASPAPHRSRCSGGFIHGLLGAPRFAASLAAFTIAALSLVALSTPTAAQTVPPTRTGAVQHPALRRHLPGAAGRPRAPRRRDGRAGLGAARRPLRRHAGHPRPALLLTDHADIANGFATPVPYNQVTIFTRPPVDGGSISYFDDWLEMVITHELVHTFHLDMTGTLGKVVRTVFGRVPSAWPVFPSGAAPTWLLEGLATYYESELTGAGRVKEPGRRW